MDILRDIDSRIFSEEIEGRCYIILTFTINFCNSLCTHSFLGKILIHMMCLQATPNPISV